MSGFDALTTFGPVIRSLPVVKVASRTAKQKLLVHFHDLISPKLLGIKNVRGKKFRCDTTSEILYCFASLA